MHGMDLPAAVKVHEQTGTFLVAALVDPFHDYGSGFLTQKESADQEDIGVPGESDP